MASEYRVPGVVAEAIAWAETGRGDHWGRRGPGVVEGERHVCREMGRYQLSPCIDWVRRLGDPLCTNHNIISHYAISVRCGIANLQWLSVHRCVGDEGSLSVKVARPNHTAGPISHAPPDIWMCVIKRQNGAGPMADAYRQKVLSYIGWLTLEREER